MVSPWITRMPSRLLWGGGNPSHGTVGEQVPPVTLEQPQSLPVPMGAPWSGRLGCVCRPPLSRGSDGAQGTRPLVKGVLRAGTWGREVPHHPAVLREGGWGSPQARLGTVLQLPAATDVCQREEARRSGSHPGAAAPREGGEASPSCHGHAGARKALAPRPSARRLTASLWHKACALRQLSTSCLQLLRPQGLGYAGEPREDIRQQHGDAPGPAEEAPSALLERQGAEKMVCSHR